jgi:purine-nucleoside phosphorylase
VRGDRGHPALSTGARADPGRTVEAARALLEGAGAGRVEGALVLGSGLSYLADQLTDRVTVPYDDIPGFPSSTVTGHAGNFVAGELEGVRVAMAQGRLHLYEGWPPAEVVLPIRVCHALGAGWLLLTNAAGSLDRRNAPGTLMAIHDHVNVQFTNPLIGRDPGGIENPFPDMSNAYDAGLRERLHEVALAEGILLREGVYGGVLGPSYETPAEIRFLRRIGVDAVGMSTVGEVIAAAELGLPVAAVSLLTNYAAGLSSTPLTHEEVTEAAKARRSEVELLVRGFVRSLGSRSGGP